MNRGNKVPAELRMREKLQVRDYPHRFEAAEAGMVTIKVGC